MKKFLLSGFLILALALYALHQNSDGSIQPTVSPRSVSTPNVPSNSSKSLASPDPSQGSQTTGQNSSSGYKNGTFTGASEDAFYGNVQVQVTISAGKITDVTFLDYPHDRSTSQYINSQAMPYLKQEAIQAQNAQVDGVSGATATSQAFQQSLQSALDQAKA